MFDQKRFQQLCHQLGGHGDTSKLFAQLAKAYSQLHRAYHTIAHIEACLYQFELAKGEADRPHEVEAALWFHDAIYDPHRSDNEEQSAAWAVQDLSQLGVQPNIVSRIADMILITKHDREPDTHDCELLLDIDLAILGQPPEIFAAYEHNIRTEYHWVPEDRYRNGRAVILQSFLNRSTIYRTKFFQIQLESQARENLQRSITTLQM